MGADAFGRRAADLVSMRIFLLGLLGLLGLALPAQAACPVPPPRTALPREAVATPLEQPEWLPMVNSLTDRMRRTNLRGIRLVFLGDSITQSWHPNLFQNFYGNRSPLNLGVQGDATQGLLWRLENGHWPAALQPDAIVLLIGTNNIWPGARPESIALGISVVVARLRQLAPQSRIVLVGLLPRGITAADPARPILARVNQLIAPCADGRNVIFVDPGQMMLDAQGTLYDWIAFDWLHLTLVGYAILSAGIEPQLRQALQR